MLGEHTVKELMWEQQHWKRRRFAVADSKANERVKQSVRVTPVSFHIKSLGSYYK